MPARAAEIVLLPASRLLAEDAPGSGVLGLDLRLLLRDLATMGYRTALANLNRAPLNPLARAHPLWRALDPLRAVSVALRRRPSVAVCCYESAALVLLALRGLLRSPVKVVVFETGVPEVWPLRDWIMRFVVRRADAVLQVCSAQVDAVQAWEPRAPPGHFVFDAVDTEYFQPGGDRPDGPVVAVGDDAGRDFATFRSAVRAMGIPAIARTGMIAEDRGRYPTLAVVSRRLSRDEYRDLLVAASLVVIPLRRSINASGVSTLLEAMALGKPVIVGASPGIGDYANHEQNCLTVPCGDIAAMIAAIERLRGDAGLRTRLGGAGRSFVEEQCSPRCLAASMDQVIRSIAGPPSVDRTG